MRTLSATRAIVTLGLFAGGALASFVAACSGADDTVMPLDGSAASPVGAERLQVDTGVEWVVELDPITRTASWAYPRTPTATILNAGQDAATVAAEFLAHYPDVFGVQRARDLQPEAVEVDVEGATHVRLLQRAAGQPVHDAVLQVHFEPDGGVSHVSGPFYPGLDALVGTPPAVTLDVATQTAIAAVTARIVAGSVPVAQPARTEVRVIQGVATLVHVIPVAVEESLWEVWVDAASGVARFVEPTLHTLMVTGAGLNGERSFDIDAPKDGAYRLTRTGNGTRSALSVFDRSYRGGGNVYSTRDPKKWDPEPIEPTTRGVAVEAFYKVGVVDGWFRRQGWSSFDGKGSEIQVDVFGSLLDPVNASFASGMLGPKLTFTAGTSARLAAIDMDTVGHEFTHGVFANTAQIASSCSAESGAINEGIADILGTLITADTVGGETGLFGDEYGLSGVVRSMRDPAMRGDPYIASAAVGADHVEGKTGECHRDAGIVDLAWILMTFGGSHPVPSRGAVKSGLALAASKTLWWNLLRYELRGVSSFQELAKRSLLVAKSKSLSQESVGCAWQAVGVLSAAELKSSYKVDCPVADAGAPDSCSKRNDGLYCSEIDKRAAFQCKGQTISGASYCAAGDHCTGPNGPGALKCTKD